MKIIKRFMQEESGATAIEYGLIAALVSVAAIAALGLMGDALEQMFTAVANALTGAVTSASGGTSGG